jgi:hypothetical protein
MRFMPAALYGLLMGALLCAAPAYAVDMNGAHRTRGVGQFTCAQFVEAKANDAALYRTFGGWIDGFISAVNFYEERTFDIAPWQSTDVIAEGLAAYCAKNAALPFEEAVKRLIEDLSSQRLVEASKLLLLEERINGQDVRLPVYTAVIERAQARLKALGYYDSEATSAFDAPTRHALKRFQRLSGRPETGLPDQVTLLLLFDQSAPAFQ